MEMNFDIEERGYLSEILSIIKGSASYDELRLALGEYHDNDIALALEYLSPEERENLFDALGVEAVSEILSYIEEAGEYLSELDDEERADVIEQMDADEALEILDTLDDDTKNAILELVEDDIRDEIKLLDSYEESQIGSRMSTNFISVNRRSTVKEAMKTLVSEAAENDNIYTLFAVNDDGSFYGAIDLHDLIVARSNDDFEQLIWTNFPFVYDNDDISENIERLRGYSEDMIPVLSIKNNELLGVITSKDIIEIIDDEREDDYAKLAALSVEEAREKSVFVSSRKRVPWLIALLFMGLMVSVVVGFFENVVRELPLIVSFQSLILGMAGNVGTQSLAVTVRKLGVEELSGKKQIGLIFRETRIALLNSLMLGGFSFLIILGYLLIIGSYSTSVAIPIAICVALALCFAMTISGFTGALIPILLYRLKADPAVASGPLITTVNDLVAVVSYYGLAYLLILNIA